MKRLFLLIGMVAFLATACEKEEMVTPFEQQEDPLAEVIRIAQEGAAMLGDAETRSAVGRRIDRSRISCKINPATRAGESDDTLYYVVNYADNAGFAIVSANEEAPDGARLIAVTESGSYTAGEQTENEGFNMYMDMVNGTRGIIGDVEIDSLPMPGLFDTIDVVEYYSPWVSQGPFLETKWGQGYKNVLLDKYVYNENFPYNKYCYNSEGELCPAGCAAIAVAQIVAYHRYPTSFVVTFDGSNRTQVLNWNSILTHVGAPYNVCTCTSHDALALLIREIGKRSSMDYSPDGSSTTLQQARFAFSYLGYDQNMGQAYSFDLVKTDIDLNRPLYMRGYDTNEQGGHAWVVDGYKQRTHYYNQYTITNGHRVLTYSNTTTLKYIHINWGFDGRNNGYYRDNVFDLTRAFEYDVNVNNDQTYNFDYALQLMTGISHN
ncbi:MAG: C10 family peptidase [Alistipes sp.]|nr:C10 family peptidase [Alistipes sp.]